MHRCSNLAQTFLLRSGMTGACFTPRKRSRIAQAGLSTPYRQVANEHNCSIGTVSRLVTELRQTGSNSPPIRHGRPSRYSLRDLAAIRRLVCKHRRYTLAQLVSLLGESGFPLSLSTLRRILKVLGLKRRLARVKPLLDKRTRRLRRNYAALHRLDDLNAWRRTIYVDEASVRTDRTFRTWVTRKDGEAWLEECMAPKLLGGRKSIMVWGAIWHGGRSKLVRFDTSQSEGKRKGVTAAIYRDQITRGELKRCWNRVNTNWRAYGGARIVEDGARVHTSKINRDIGKRQRFRYMRHPPSSPDLNPIENCWAHLKRKLAQLPRRPTTPETLFEALQQIWNAIPQTMIDRMIDSMPRRLKKVKERHGFTTKY